MTERVRILVIDDESDVLDTISVALELAGFDVLAAADGSRGMALANAEHPAAILLDVQMPALNGIEVCKRLKNDVATASIPVIILSARADLAARSSAAEAGADDYVGKPFAMRELVGKIRSLLR